MYMYIYIDRYMFLGLMTCGLLFITNIKFPLYCIWK